MIDGEHFPSVESIAENLRHYNEVISEVTQIRSSIEQFLLGVDTRHLPPQVLQYVDALKQSAIAEENSYTHIPNPEE